MIAWLSRVGIVPLLAATSVAAQVTMPWPGQMRMPPRDSSAAESTGTARLRGIVVGGEAGMPLRRAVVSLFGEGLQEGRVTTTDADGRWELADLPAGRFSLSASKAGYVQLNYGQRRPFEQGRPIEIADGQTLENVNFNLPRGAVIAGRIVDEFGEPVAEVNVAALRYRYFNGRRRLVPAGRFGHTDDGGHFRIYGLAPGEYYLAATFRGGMMNMNSADRSGYAPTYYPGTASARDAQPIALALGGEMSGLTFSLLPVRTARISGLALGADGSPMKGGFVNLLEVARGDTFTVSFGGGTRIREDGTFTLSNVSPGEYTLQAHPLGSRRGSLDEIARATVTVGSDDITNLVVAVPKPTIIRGQIAIEGLVPGQTVAPAAMHLFAMVKDADQPFFGAPELRDGVQDDWTFELLATDGPVLIRAMRPPAGLTLKSVTLNGQDVTDTGIAFRPGETVSGVQVTLTTASSRVSGTVTDDRGGRVMDYAVVVFADDPARWGFMSRFIRLARPDQSGEWQVRELPPGRYVAAAIEAIEEGEEHNPALLERLLPIGTAFTLGEGEQRALSLRIVQAY